MCKNLYHNMTISVLHDLTNVFEHNAFNIEGIDVEFESNGGMITFDVVKDSRPTWVAIQLDIEHDDYRMFTSFLSKKVENKTTWRTLCYTLDKHCMTLDKLLGTIVVKVKTCNYE